MNISLFIKDPFLKSSHKISPLGNLDSVNEPILLYFAIYRRKSNLLMKYLNIINTLIYTGISTIFLVALTELPFCIKKLLPNTHI